MSAQAYQEDTLSRHEKCMVNALLVSRLRMLQVFVPSAASLAGGGSAPAQKACFKVSTPQLMLLTGPWNIREHNSLQSTVVTLVSCRLPS